MHAASYCDGGWGGTVADPFPLLTAVVAFALTVLLARQYLAKRKRHLLVWTLSLGLLGLAAVLAFLGNPDVLGWSPLLYRAYLPLTALPVGLIGLGVLQLFRNRPALATYYGIYWGVTAILVVAVTAVAGIQNATELAAQGPAVGGRYLPAFGAVSWLQTVPGAIVFIGGGVYSWWKDHARIYGLFLALGGILFSVAGFSSRLGAPSAFFVITALAAIAMFLGFILAVEHAAAAPSPAKA